MHYSVSCNCGHVNISAFLPLPVEDYEARECSCRFCVSRGLAYISDVNGTISFDSLETMAQLKQGSGQAIFWQCNNCQQVVAVTNQSNGEIRGALSKKLFAKRYTLKPSISVSPQTLSPAQKAERWALVWSQVV